MESLIMKLRGERHFHPAKYYGWNDAVHEGGEHQPAEPDALPEYFNRLDSRVFRRDKLHDGIAEDEYTEAEQHYRAAHESNQHCTAVSVGECFVRRFLTEISACKKRTGGHEAQRVLDPHRLHGL